MLDEQVLAIMAIREKSKVKPLTKIFERAKKAPKKSKTRRKASPKGSHRMADGSTMTGKTHSKDSRIIRETRKSKKTRGRSRDY